MKPNQKLLFIAVTLYPGGEKTEISFLAGVVVVGWLADVSYCNLASWSAGWFSSLQVIC